MFKTFAGFSCVAMGTNYKMKLLGYTVGPIFLLVMIVLPCTLARVLLSHEQRSIDPWKSRYQSARATMMNNICYFLFLIYPTVSLTALKGFHCRDFGPPHGSLLMSDVQILCPYGREDGDAFLFAWTLGAILAYPLGIPLFLYIVLVRYQIPRMAERKIVEGSVRVMIQMYMEETCHVSFKQLANALWTQEQVEGYFCLLCNKDRRIVIRDLKYKEPGDNNKKFKELLHSALVRMGMTADLDEDEFHRVATDIVSRVNEATQEFIGPMELQTLTAQQIKLLLNHDYVAGRGEIEAAGMFDDLVEEDGSSSNSAEKEKVRKLGVMLSRKVIDTPGNGKILFSISNISNSMQGVV